VEHPAYALEGGPAWLKVDPATGLLSGTPDAAGRSEVVVSVTTDREVRKLDPGSAGWGVEKVVSTSAERVGADTQRFTIEVSG
jgi:Putative Ig domain